MLKTQVQLLTTQLTLLTEKRARKKKAKAAAQAAAAMEAQKQAKKPKQPRPKQPTPGGSSSGFPKPPKQPRATKKRAFTDLDPDKIEELTYDQKRELSENINILTQEQLSRVLQIIRENTHIDEVPCRARIFIQMLEILLTFMHLTEPRRGD